MQPLLFRGATIDISTVDWYGKSATVIFFKGCNFNCLYCSNKDFIDMPGSPDSRAKNERVVDIEVIEREIRDARPFISAVVFSGGEPTLHLPELKRLASFAKSQGLLVGIETNGHYPTRLKDMIVHGILDQIFLDIKAPLDCENEYERIIGGITGAPERIWETLNLKGINIEVRTTVFPSFASRIPKIAKNIEGYNYPYVIQQGRPELAPDGDIQKEKSMTRDELATIAESLTFLNDVRIRTREKGEERINRYLYRN